MDAFEEYTIGILSCAVSLKEDCQSRIQISGQYISTFSDGASAVQQMVLYPMSLECAGVCGPDVASQPLLSGNKIVQQF